MAVVLSATVPMHFICRDKLRNTLNGGETLYQDPVELQSDFTRINKTGLP